jgi:hypothetical protein
LDDKLGDGTVPVESCDPRDVDHFAITQTWRSHSIGWIRQFDNVKLSDSWVVTTGRCHVASVGSHIWRSSLGNLKRAISKDLNPLSAEWIDNPEIKLDQSKIMTWSWAIKTEKTRILIFMSPLNAIRNGRVTRHSALHSGHMTKNHSSIHWWLDNLRAHWRKRKKKKWKPCFSFPPPLNTILGVSQLSHFMPT